MPSPRSKRTTVVEVKIAIPARASGRHLVQQFATAVWGNQEAAARWLSTPHLELDGKAPESLLNTAPGIRRVENLLSALENGFPV